MKLIVGLGNIGSKYEKTNHNAGFMVVDDVASRLGVTFKNRGCESDYGEYRNENDKFIFAKPRTFMNDSGKAVKSFMAKFKIKIEDVLVVCDDIDLAPGRVRIRKTGSAGTHNGLKSITNETKSQDFVRLRVGIGSKNEHQDLADFVLSVMRMTDEQKQGLSKAADALEEFIAGEKIDIVMGKFNN